MHLLRRWIPRLLACAIPVVPAVVSADEKPKLDPGTYAVQLRGIEQDVNELKEAIRQRHTHLALLSEMMFGGLTAPARADITFDNEMSSFFRLRRLVVVYDGVPLTSKSERDGIANVKEIPIYRDLVLSGDHTVQVLLEYQGNGEGIFSYLSGYRFKVHATRSFTVLPGRTLQLHIVGHEQGGPTTPFEDRPAVKFLETTLAGAAKSP